MDNNNLGVILRARRKERGFTLTQLSSLSGLHISHIERLETGERFPRGRTLRRLAKPLGFTELELLKAAGFISQEGIEEILDKVKQAISDDHCVGAYL